MTDDDNLCEGCGEYPMPEAWLADRQTIVRAMLGTANALAKVEQLSEALRDVLALTAQHTWTSRDQPRIAQARAVLAAAKAL